MDRKSKKTNATRRKHLVYIQTKTSASDGRGGFTETWNEIGPVWASVDPIRAVKLQEYRSANVNATHLINISAKASITEHNRIRFGTRYFEIQTIENLQERDIDLVITATETRA
ncbi:MAG: phage head closure protein [Chitinispirillaceae bacterium]|nr:phage head closure protein [Chitinispirillaceae bacterium]